jgi:hypothetical protein
LSSLKNVHGAFRSYLHKPSGFSESRKFSKYKTKEQIKKSDNSDGKVKISDPIDWQQKAKSEFIAKDVPIL